MAGRRPKPRALKLVTGNPGKRPIPLDEPTPIPGSPEKPEGLGKDGSAEWDRLCAMLEGEQRLALADRSHLLGAVKSYQNALDFERKARRRGIPDDEWRKFKTGERMQWAEYRKFTNDLCLSQGTRARAKIGGRGKETSALGAFLSRRAPKPVAG